MQIMTVINSYILDIREYTEKKLIFLIVNVIFIVTTPEITI